MYKTGLGYDIHRFADGRKLFLGGVEIPHEKGLEGHSDADVLLHALCDAILGALGKGDIGEHFPNTDPKYKGISSLELLKEVVTLMKADGYEVGNADMALQAEEPPINPHKPKMVEAIANILGVKRNCVNIKATTNEKLGSIGRSEGIAAFATVLLKKSD